jgi:hypothetical protein
MVLEVGTLSLTAIRCANCHILQLTLAEKLHILCRVEAHEVGTVLYEHNVILLLGV